MIRKVIPVMPFQAGIGGFIVPRGYRFVRRLVNSLASEYYLFPFHWPARLYWKVVESIWRSIFYVQKKKKKTK